MPTDLTTAHPAPPRRAGRPVHRARAVCRARTGAVALLGALALAAIAGPHAGAVEPRPVTPALKVSVTAQQHYAGNPAHVSAQLAVTGSAYPTGLLTYRADGTAFATRHVNRWGTESLPTFLPRDLALGKHAVTVTFRPDAATTARHIGGASASGTVTVVRGVAKVTLARIGATTLNRTQYGRVVARVRITGVYGPSGTFVLREGSKVLSSLRLQWYDKGSALFILPTGWPSGTHAVTVSYSPDVPTIAPGHSAPATFVVR
ncbi:hypothetical protein [Luteimicrobium subarcticum]|uniref:Ig-like domain-containing protein n=1 Tax=Luteimicrobium subarcticum TaxID=620910 RepID=A0A2M8WTI4_9MICO|nr:hypothetical protein [Luteimicrobium subarcticum]PJI94271.1 hypothetical protein CLV34_1759 [Luteimicrobium subarcticum]